ncbi:tyrosine/serine protein phosphatase [Nemania sp. FL0916]|nr:tyrosine/serine protein phosphatase [Nemania sp. FL0916]
MSIEFENILNFRDVGKTVNDYLGRKVVREGVLYRSARPDDATLGDRKKLTQELDMRTVIDLRSKTEHLSQAKKRQADLKIPSLLQSNAALAEPMQIPGLAYREVQVTGKRLERALVCQLSWWDFIKLIVLVIFGFRTQAAKIIGEQVMQPVGLVGLTLITLDESGPEIAEVSSPFPFPFSYSPINTSTYIYRCVYMCVYKYIPIIIHKSNIPPSPPQALRILSTQTQNPSLVHCTQGKDRTGMIVALALLALHIPSSAVAHDYLLSQPGLEPERAERVAEMRYIGLDSTWGDCDPDMIARVQGHLDVRYGGVDAYLDAIGFGGGDRARLVEALGA